MTIAHNQHVHFDFFCRCLKSLQTGVDHSDVHTKQSCKPKTLFIYYGNSAVVCGPVFIAPCVLVLQALESDHLEKLQARPEFTAFSHKDGSTSNSLERILTTRSTSYLQGYVVRMNTFWNSRCPKSASRSRLTWLFRYT